MRTTRRALLMLALALALGACANGTDPTERCTGLRCPPERDAEVIDGSAALDAGGAITDAGSAPTDAGLRPVDGGSPDGGMTECGGARCDLWMLPGAATRWTAFSRGTSGFAPTTPVRAAFDVESLGRAWILTDGTYHVVRITDGAWLAGGERNALFPEASGAAILTAFSLPGADEEIVFLNTATTAYEYRVRWSDGAISFTRLTTSFGPEWSVPSAPSRAAMRFDWTDLDNARGWTTVDPRTLCDTTVSSLTRYVVVGTDSATHLYDGTACYEFFQRTPHPSFAPLSLPGAPPVSVIGAAFMNAGALYLFAE